MAVHKFYDPRIYLAGRSITTDLSSVAVATGAESLDATRFSDVARNSIGGLKTHTLSAEGYQQYGSELIEDIIRQQVGVGAVYTVTPEGGAVGEEAYFGVTLVNSHQPVGGTVGDIHKFTFAGVAVTAIPASRGNCSRRKGRRPRRLRRPRCSWGLLRPGSACTPRSMCCRHPARLQRWM